MIITNNLIHFEQYLGGVFIMPVKDCNLLHTNADNVIFSTLV